jgi:CPA1 family monovalent cation:H+ antiporter
MVMGNYGRFKILNTLETQTARVIQEKKQQFAPKEYFIEPLYIRLTNIVRKVFSLPPKPADPEEVYLYYRAQYKLISKDLHELSALEKFAFD